MATTRLSSSPTIQEQTPVALVHAAGYVGHRIVAVGLRRGLMEALAEAAGGATPDELADRLGLDPFYVSVWCRRPGRRPPGGLPGRDPGPAMRTAAPQRSVHRLLDGCAHPAAAARGAVIQDPGVPTSASAATSRSWQLRSSDRVYASRGLRRRTKRCARHRART
jgi:hypothetical protein